MDLELIYFGFAIISAIASTIAAIFAIRYYRHRHRDRD